MGKMTANALSGGLAAVLLCAAPPATAADWAQWGGTNNRNMVSAETNLPRTFEPNAEKALGDARFLSRIAGAISGGIDAFFAEKEK